MVNDSLMPNLKKIIFRKKQKGITDQGLKDEVDRLTRKADYLRSEGFIASADRVELHIATLKNKQKRRLIDGDKHPG